MFCLNFSWGMVCPFSYQIQVFNFSFPLLYLRMVIFLAPFFLFSSSETSTSVCSVLFYLSSRSVIFSLIILILFFPLYSAFVVLHFFLSICTLVFSTFLVAFTSLYLKVYLSFLGLNSSSLFLSLVTYQSLYLVLLFLFPRDCVLNSL